MQKIIRYEVIDNKGRWMGNYSPEIDGLVSMSALEMAKVNARRSSGKVYAIYPDDSRQEVFSV